VSPERSLERVDPRRRSRIAVVLLAVAVGVVVYLVSVSVFPYHSLNHDEAVYLQQAAMLLEGQLFLYPPIDGAFRPWFFVESGGVLYPKYSPVVAVVFAGGTLLGSARFALVGVAVANVALTYGVLSAAFDRPTGIVGAGLLVLSPLFLVQSAVFLPYAPTTAANLLFAFAYLRADEDGDRRWAAVAGLAVGAAFFARPYTAVLFATPWIVHACWTLRSVDRATWVRQSVTAALGLVGVGVALGYNAVVTGSPLLFPYEAFAPLDGLGFGQRAILAHEVEYTPGLAVRSNLSVLHQFFTRWASAGVLGTLLAVFGVVCWAVRGRRDGFDSRQVALFGVGVAVVVGNVYFWGNYNVLGNPAVPDDGLINFLGPYYHFDLLVPTAAFGARGTLALADRYRELATDRLERPRPAVVAGVVVCTAVLVGAGGLAMADPVSDNRSVTDRYHAAYEPFEDRDLRGSVVLLPEPYGDWLNHPFQALRNDPGFDGPTVYARRERALAVAEIYPDRPLYRYTYRGEWAPTEGPPVTPRLQRVRTVTGDRAVVNATLGVPDGVERVSIRVGTEEEGALYAARGTPDRLSLSLVVEDDGDVSLRGPLERVGDGRVAVGARDRVTVDVLLDYAGGGGVTYRIELPVERDGGRVRALTPYLEVCRTARECGGDAAYVPDATGEGISMDVTLRDGTSGSVPEGRRTRSVGPVRSPRPWTDPVRPRVAPGKETHKFRTA
jgi:hypothetical protein